jgi:hypothetical protein
MVMKVQLDNGVIDWLILDLRGISVNPAACPDALFIINAPALPQGPTKQAEDDLTA